MFETIHPSQEHDLWCLAKDVSTKKMVCFHVKPTLRKELRGKEMETTHVDDTSISIKLRFKTEQLKTYPLPSSEYSISVLRGCAESPSLTKVRSRRRSFDRSAIARNTVTWEYG